MPPRMRGRRRGPRWIESLPVADYYYPRLHRMRPTGVVKVTVEELEAVRLVDLEELTQEEAAARMGVSRKTLWRDLSSARKKIADALINGLVIEISGGDYILRGRTEKSEEGGE